MSFQQCFYTLEKNKISIRFIQVFYFLVIDQNGPKHVGVSGFYNVIQICAFVGLKRSTKNKFYVFYSLFEKRTLNKNS